MNPNFLEVILRPGFLNQVPTVQEHGTTVLVPEKKAGFEVRV